MKALCTAWGAASRCSALPPATTSPTAARRVAELLHGLESPLKASVIRSLQVAWRMREEGLARGAFSGMHRAAWQRMRPLPMAAFVPSKGRKILSPIHWQSGCTGSFCLQQML